MNRYRMHKRDPLEFGPSPLVTEKDRPMIERLIDRLQAEITEAITTRVPMYANPLLNAGYRVSELQIEGFGNDITVRPLDPPMRYLRIRLQWRRLLIRFGVITPSRDYREIVCTVYDTERLIKGLGLFSDQRKAIAHESNS